MLGQRRLVISEKSIQTWQSNSHSTVSMNEVKFVMRDDHNHYLMMEPAVGFIIPNSALETASNNAELKQFLASRIAP